jgi:cytidine deaminase
MAALDPVLLDRLKAAATAVRQHAYAPASSFHVGAAVLADDGRVFAGCNVENASYGLTICAEPARPCGACRQVLAEFGRSLEVVLVGRGVVRQTCLDQLLPDPFTFADVQRGRS